MPPSNLTTQPSTTTTSSTTPTTPETSAPDRPEHIDQSPEADNTSAPDNGQPPASTTADDPAPPSTSLEPDSSIESQGPTASEQREQTNIDGNVDVNTNTMETDSSDSSTDSNAVTGPSTADVEDTHEQEIQDEDEQDDEEHPYWAEIEEDTSAPDEEELKEIEAGQGDHSAYEYEFWEDACFRTLDDPEYRPTEKARVTWKITGVRGTPEKPNRSLIIRSPAAYVGGYYWTFKFFPRGNSVSSLSLYVECSPTAPEPDAQNLHTEFKVVKGPPDAALSSIMPDVELTLPATENKRKRKQAPGPAEVTEETHESEFHGEPSGSTSGTAPVDSDSTSKQNWRVSAEIGAVLYNPNEPRTGHFHSACHQFNPHNNDWGWTDFHGPWDQIHRRQRGQRQALLRDDTLAFDVYIRTVDDPTHSLWWHSSDAEPVWNSYAVTGYKPVGDDSENFSHEVAGLVTWLMISPVRQLIQHIDILEHLRNPNVKPRPLCNALQRFLYSLRNDPPGPQLYVSAEGVLLTLRNLRESSRDPVGFWEVLRRSLELELEGTSAKMELAKMFDSRDGSSDVNTLPSEYNSRIALPASKTTSVQSGLTHYLGGKPGKWALPLVLHVELTRQSFDKSAHRWKMHLDRVRMDEDLDLSNFVSQDQTGKYTIYGFVVHKGSRTSGQFYSILRPGGPGTKWLSFQDGCDRNVFCLTRKAAIEGHEGLDSPKESDEKNPPDVAVTVLYVRNDKLADYLPKELEKWEMPKLREHYFKTADSSLQLALQETGRQNIQVELFQLSNPSSSVCNSLFDAYDLMSASRAAGECCTLDLSPDTSFADMRKQYAQWASREKDKEIDPEDIRFWKVGARQAHCPPALHLETINDLSSKISLFELDVLRLWVHFLSKDDAQYFAQLDPEPPRAAVAADGPSHTNVPEQPVEEAPAPAPTESGDARPEGVDAPTDDGDAIMSDDNAGPDEDSAPAAQRSPQHDDNEAENRETQTPEDAGSQQVDAQVNGESPQEDEVMSDEPQQQHTVTNGISSTDEAAIAAVIADDVEELDRAEESGQRQTTSSQENTGSGSAGADGDVVMGDSREPHENSQPSRGGDVVVDDEGSDSEMDEDEEVEQPPARRPNLIPLTYHFHFFVQIFDEEKQELRYAGSFLANRNHGAKLSVLKALEYPPSAGYLVWQRLDGAMVASVGSTQLFEDIVPYSHEGDCFIVGKDLTSTQRTKLSEAGMFPNPHGLVQYHWDLARRHPVNAFTGKKSVEASYGGHSYSGDFKNGQWHGKGTHVAETGAIYVGDFVLGQRQGTGSMVYATGDTYEGDWFDDQRHGQGTFIERKTGNKYVGGYRNGKRHGKGISYWEVADEEMGLCQICYTEEQDALFYPCGHVCACVECASQVDICPMCRQKSVNVVKIYRS